MPGKLLWMVMAVCMAALCREALAEETNMLDGLGINWIIGPTNANLKDVAEIKLPDGYRMSNPKDTRKLLEEMGNPTDGSELGLLFPPDGGWFVLFEFNPTGYIKDDDKDKLDPDAMLKSIKEGTEYANKERKKMGAPEMQIIGWDQPPRYNSETHNLEWAIRGESEGHLVVNYNTRILGRKGVMKVNLVVEPEKLAETMSDYQAVLNNYNFKQGERYAEYRQGDKVAKYGLAALVTGGAAVVAVKTGLFAYLLIFLKKGYKLIVVALAAVASFFKRLFGGRKKHPMAE